MDILKSYRIKLSDADKLNDPFELMPRVDPSRVDAAGLMFMLMQQHWVDTAYAEEGERRGFKNKKDFEVYYNSTLANRAVKLESMLKADGCKLFWENADQFIKRSATLFREHFKLVCGTGCDNSILLWSHYAQQHQGIVVELNLNKTPFAELPTSEILEVEYREERFEMVTPTKPSEQVSGMHQLAKRKALAWRYEHEIRIVIPPSMCGSGDFAAITAECINGVILGCRARPESVSEIMALADRPELSHIYVKKAVPHRDKFELEYHLLKGGGSTNAINPNWPKTVADAVNRIISHKLTEAEIEKINRMTKDDLLSLYFDLGVWIRNNLGLCNGNEELLRDCAKYSQTSVESNERMKINATLCEDEIHADSACIVILWALRERLQAEKK